LGGRALETFRPLLATKTLERILTENPAGCAVELTDTSHFHIDLFGNYIPGLCSGLAIFRDDLGAPLSTERYPILTGLFHKGIKGLFEFAKQYYAFSPQRTDYINKCDLCTEIRTHLVNNDYSISNELKPKEFYWRS